VLSPRELAALRFVEAGKSLLDQADLDRAREQFERAVALAPLQPYGYYFLGRVAFARHQHKQAVAFLRKAELLFAPGDQAWLGETTSLQGAVYEDLGDYAQARAAYQRCLQVTPANLKALSALARLPEEGPSLRDAIQR
jgi:tetratricopeptide (TPR) repeat protein